MNKAQLTIQDILHTLLSHLLVILLAGALVGAAAWAYTTYRIPKMYQTSVTFYAMSKTNRDNSDVTSGDMADDRALASTYSYVMRSNVVMKEAAKRLQEAGIKTPGGGNYSYAALKGMTSISTTNTQIFTATFSSSDRSNLQELANTVAEAGVEKIAEIVGGEAKILDAAEPVGGSYYPDVRGNTVTGVLIGILIAAAIVIIRALTDTTIWTEEDISKQYSIPVLGSVPQLATLEKQNTTKE